MISIIIPAYNEEKGIEITLKRLKKVKEIDEIIVVDDGSFDKTPKVAGKYAKVVSYKPNKGKGYAMRKGVEAAAEDTVMFIDASQFDPFDIPKLVGGLENADMVVGIRDFNVVPWPRRITNTLAKLAILLGTGKKINDPISGFRVLRKDDFLSLETKEDRYAIESEMSFKALLKKMKIKEIPVEVTYHGERPREKWGGLKGYFEQRVLHETVFNTVTVFKIWLGIFK